MYPPCVPQLDLSMPVRFLTRAWTKPKLSLMGKKSERTASPSFETLHIKQYLNKVVDWTNHSADGQKR